MAADGTRARARSPRGRCKPAIGLLLLSAMVAGCGGEDPVDGDTLPTRVRAVVLPYLTHVPFSIAREEGFFAAEDLDVEFVRMGRQEEVLTALARGEVDVAAGMLAVNEIALAVAGHPVRIVAALSELAPDACPFAAVIARAALATSGALDDPARIRELRFDVSATLPLAFALDRLLADVGLRLEDVTVDNLAPPAAVEALAMGTIDVSVDSEPFVTEHLRRGEAVIWRSVGDISPGFVSSVLMYGPRLVEDPELGTRFATAMRRALDQFRRGKTPRNLDIAEQASGLSRTDVVRACWPVVPATGEIDPDGFRPYLEWTVARGLVDRLPADDELFDARFMRAAGERLASLPASEPR